MKAEHPVPDVGDTVTLNDHGLEQCFGSTTGLRHMKTLEMKVTFVDPESLTFPEKTFPVEVDNEDINHFLLDHLCFDIVHSPAAAVEADYRRYVQKHQQTRRAGEPITFDAWRSMTPVGREGFYSLFLADIQDNPPDLLPAYVPPVVKEGGTW